MTRVTWHRVVDGVAMERQFDVLDGGAIKGGVVSLRGLRTVGCWTTHKLLPEFLTQASYEAYLASKGYQRGPAPSRTVCPTTRTMHRWMMDGVARALDGCRVEPDGVCPHSKSSWLLVAGVI